jgi:hypothetical protein
MLIGDPRTLRALAKALRKLPITASARIAARAAPEMSQLAGGAYDTGVTVYNAARPRGTDGSALSLEQTGATRRAVEFRATGRDIRTAPLPRYARYLIGKYDILPNGPLPAAWRERMTRIAAQVLYEDIHLGFGKGGQ